jgi:transcriptional regulator GlxA family with amidase domain
VALRTLQRRFRKAFGVTMVEVLLRARVERVKTLLSAGDLSIKEIACLTGFASPSHLGTTFHRFEGIRPGAFRKRTAPASR